MARYGHNEYKPEYDALIVEMFSKGDTLADFCVKVGNGRTTVYDWIKRYPRGFAKAYEYARECAKAYRDNYAKEQMWQTYGEEGENFDVKSYLRMTQPRFKDMERETRPPDILGSGKNPDLYKAINKLIAETANESLTIEQAKAITAIINTAVNIKEKEFLAGKLEEIENLIKAGALESKTPVISPAAEAVEAE